MPTLTDFSPLATIHWETGSIANALAFDDVRAPHTGRPYDEPLLLGIGGGIGFMYYVFEYVGHDPSLYIATRYNATPWSRDPMRSMCDRVGLAVRVDETTSPAKAAATLVATLERGHPVIVWASLAGSRLGVSPAEMGAFMTPLFVYGHDKATDVFRVAAPGRARTIPADALARGRAAQGNYKHRQWTLEPAGSAPDLATAVRAGIADGLAFFLSGPQRNFGLDGIAKWAELMADPKDKKGWPKVFARGPALFSGQAAAFDCLESLGTGGGATRHQYAAFLDQASPILGQPSLREIAARFRECGDRWRALADALLPDAAPILAEARTLLRRRADLATANVAVDEWAALDTRLDEIKRAVAHEYPLAETAVAEWRADIRDRLRDLHGVEQTAWTTLHDCPL